MNAKDLSRVLDEISDEQVPQEVNLLPGILTQVKKGNHRTMKPDNKLAVAFLATITVLAVLLFTLPGVGSAMRKMLGFIPGVGLVDQTVPLRVLAAPVTDTRDGFTLTVDNAVIDSQRTVVSYQVEGPFENGTTQADGVLSKVCFDAAELRLPDGSVFHVSDDFPKATWASGYRAQNSYPVIPANVDRAELFLPCLHAQLAGHGPEDWSVPLTFVPAPPELTVYPLTAQATPTTAPATAEAVPTNVPLTAAAPTEPAAQAPHGITLTVDSVIPLPDGQLVQARLDWHDNPNLAGVTVYPEDVQIFDASGQIVIFDPSDEAFDPGASEAQSAQFGYKTAVITASGPARLVVNPISEAVYHASESFSFDPGIMQQPEQVWELNQALEVDGRVLRIARITVTEAGGNASLTIEMQSADGIIGAGVFDLDHPALSGSSGSDSAMDDGIQKFWSSFNYDGGLPAGPITLTLTGYTVRLAGPWIVEWTPAPAAPDAALSSAQPQAACLSKPAWQTALTNPQPIPAELNGRVLFEGYNTEKSLSYLATARLDGSEVRTLIEGGHDASLSADGSRVAYLDSDGLHVYDLATATNELIPGTNNNTGVFRSFWSPDGQRIGFTGTPGGASPNIFLAELDGSGPRLLENGEILKLMQGWLADGRILYVTMGAKGPVLKLIDPQSGESTALVDVPELAAPVALAQDGQRLALKWMDEPGGKQLLYVLTLDGSQRKPLLELPGDGYVRSMLWSPDGDWLLVDLSWDLANEPYTKSLVQVDTCQVIPVSNLDGSVVGWLP